MKKVNRPANELDLVVTTTEIRKDLLRYFPAKVIPPLISILTVIIYARILTPGDLGRYIIVYSSAVMVATALASLWGSSGIRLLPTDKRERGEFYSTLALLSLCTAAVLVGLGYLIFIFSRGFISPKSQSLLLPGFVLASLYLLYEVALYLLNAQRRASSYTAFSLIRITLGPALGISAVLLTGQGALAALWGYAIVTGILLIPLAVVTLSTETNYFRASTVIARKATLFGLPLLASTLLGWFLGIFDRYIIGFFRGSQEVAIYSVAYSLSEQPLNLISGLIMLTGWPLVVRAWEEREQAGAREILSKLVRLYLLFALPAVAALWLLSKPVLGLLTTPPYHAGFKVIPLVALGAFLMGVQKLVSTGPLLHKITHLSLVATLLAAIFNIILNLLFIPRYGYLAAAIITPISYTFLLLVTPLVTRSYIVWSFPFSSCLKIFSATSAAVLVMALVWRWLPELPLTFLIVFLLLLGGVTYLIVLMLTKEIGFSLAPFKGRTKTNLRYDICFNRSDLWGRERPLEEKARLQELLSLIPANVSSILDAGCGDGALVNRLASRYSQVIGLDLSLEALRYVRVSKLLASLKSIPFPDRSFDLVICSEVLEHLPEDIYISASTELQRVANKYLLISVPNNELLEQGMMKCGWCGTVFHSFGHVRTFTVTGLQHHFPQFELYKHILVGPTVKWFSSRWLLRIRQWAGGWALNPLATCPHCGNQESFVSRRTPLVVASNLLYRMLPGRVEQRWLVALFKRR